jgi:DNA polymerase elongation subunit (family B)
MKLLVQNTEQIQPDDINGTHVVVYCRARENPAERKRVVVEGFRPYFYVAADEVSRADTSIHCIEEIDFDTDFEAFGGGDVAKVYTPYPQDVPEAKEYFETHYAADVPFTNRFRIDTGIEAYIEVPDDAFDGNEARVNYREIEKVVPPSSDDNPRG